MKTCGRQGHDTKGIVQQEISLLLPNAARRISPVENAAVCRKSTMFGRSNADDRHVLKKFANLVELFGCVRYRCAVITRGRCDIPSPPLLLGYCQQFIESATSFEGTGDLEVFELEKNVSAREFAQNR